MADALDPTAPPPAPVGTIPSPAALPVALPQQQAGAAISPFAVPANALATDSPLKPLLAESLRNIGFVSERANPFTSEMESTYPDSFAELIRRSITAPPLEVRPDIELDLGQTGQGGRLPFNLARAGEAFLYTLGETPLGQLAHALQQGFGEPLIPAAQRLGQIREGVNYEYVPGYDIFKDKRIIDAGLGSQMHLFYGSMSPNQSKWIIDRIADKARMADHFERMGSGAAVVQFAAGILGDPLTYTPATLGVKGAGLANKLMRGTISGNEIALISSPVRMTFGTIADGLKYAGVTGALAVAQASIRNGFDPTESIDEVVDSLYVPMALAGSTAMLISAFSRRTARSLALRSADPDFLKGTPPSGARYVPDDLIGPVIHPTDEAAAGLVSRYDDAATQARRMERTEPGDRFDRAPGPRKDMPFNGVPDEHGNLPPGSLATDYGKMRKDEFAAKPENAPYVPELPIVRYRREAATIEATLPPVAEGHTRLWRGNRPDEVGLNPGFTNDLPGIALPFRDAYKGPLSYVDVPTADLGKYVSTGAAATNAEFHLPAELARQAREPHIVRRGFLDDQTSGKAKTKIATGKTDAEIPHDASGSRELVLHGQSRSAAEFPTGHMIETPKGDLWRVNEVDGVKRFELWDTKAAGTGVGEPIPIIVNTIDERGRDRVHDRSGTYLNAKDLPEGQRLSDPSGNILVVRNGVFYPEEIKQTPMASAATGGRGFLPTREEQAAAEQAAAGEATTKPKRLVDMEFKPGELPRAELGTTSKDLEDTPGLIATPPRDLAAGVHEKGAQQAYVIMPDGRIFEISREFRLSPEEIDDLMGSNPSYDAHASLFARFPELPNHVIRLTRFEDSIAADLPAAGRTPQQTATLRRLKNSWEREGLGDKVRLGLDAPGAEKPALQRVADELAASEKPTNEHLGVGQPAAALAVSTIAGKLPDRAVERLTNVIEGNSNQPIRLLDFDPGVVAELERAGFARDGIMTRRQLDALLEARATEETGSVGAALSPQSLVYQREVLLAQNRMAPTGIGMERWALSPIHRIFLGESVEAMHAAGDLVSTGGSITIGNKQGIGSAVPVETLIQSNWEHMTLDAVRGMKDDWAEARHANAAASGQTQPTTVDFSGRSDIRRLGAELGDAIKRKFVRGEPGLSYDDFNRRVTAGLRNGDVDAVSDGSTPYVQRSIARHREVYEITKAKMIEHGIFDEAYEGAKFDAYAEVRAVQKDIKEIANRANIERWPAARQRMAEEALMARLEDAEFQAKQAEDQLEKLRQHGPQLNGTAPSYAPRMWDAGALKRGEEHFIADIAVPWLMKPTSAGGAGIADTLEATRIAKEMHTLLSKQNPVFERADVKQLFHSVAAPNSAMARTFAIPDELVKDFLVDDAETLLRYHVKQNATAVEMKRRFGSLDMAEQIAAVEQEYRGQIIAANAGSDVPTEEAKRLVKLMKSDISDLQALRDKLYGTYGAAMDPHAWDSRLIRMAKQFANITLLGGSGVSSLGDFVRPLMTEGLEAMYGYGLRSLMGDMRGTILRLGKEDMQLAGVGSDLMNNVRALQAADTGDVFGSRGRLEHGLSTANQWMFVANGLNQITEWSKNWANIIIQGKMNKAIMQWGTVGAQELPEVSPGMVRVWHGGKVNPNDLGAVNVHGDFEIQARTHGDQHLWYADVPEDSPWLNRQVTRDVQDSTAPAGTGFTLVGAPGEGQISAFMVTRLASLGIDEAMARRIALQLKVHGKDFDDLKLANVGQWKNDDLALETYKAALNQSVNRTVVTPGVGDRPNILSTELGSLIGQYKSWAIANMTRSLQSGLQEGGSQFWYGAAAAVGFAIVLNELKSRLMYDRSTFDRPATAVIADGIDRSSILGWFSDANRAVETLSGNRLGVKALTGSQPQPIDPARVVGTLGGPAAGQAVRAASVVNDFISGHPTARTYNNLRTVMPGSTLPYLDPVYDHLISDGNFHKGMQRSAEKQGRPVQ